ncbi:MAG: hypothetical protein U1A72_17500 [Sulfuritalea sp.]|nr:hypothetical protein [Sulfuritalea sp.]
MQVSNRLGMNAREKRQRIDVSKETVEEIFADTRRLLCVKRLAFEKVGLRRAGNLDLHQ